MGGYIQSLVRAFASYVMQSPMHAILATAIAAFLSAFFLYVLNTVVFLPLFWVTGGLISLITLRHGIIEGGKILLAAMAAHAVGIYFAIGHINITNSLLLFVPVWLLANSLRQTGSQWFLAKSALIFAGVLMVSLFFSWDDNMVEVQNRWIEQLIESKAITRAADEEFVNLLKLMILGAAVAIVMVGYWLASNYVGRWWQAVLYNPGGFRKEFHQFRVSQNLAIAALLAIAIVMTQQDTIQYLAGGFLALIGAVYWLGGVALMHGIAGRLNLHWGVFLIFYVINLFPPMPFITAGAGFLDSWFDFRQYFTKKDPQDKD